MEEKINVQNTKNGQDLYGELRNKITNDRAKFREQLREIKDKIEKNNRDSELLATLRDKLEGAIEASDAFLRSVLPTNNSK